MATKRGPNIEYRDNSDLIVDALEKAINNGLTANEVVTINEV